MDIIRFEHERSGHCVAPPRWLTTVLLRVEAAVRSTFWKYNNNNKKKGNGHNRVPSVCANRQGGKKHFDVLAKTCVHLVSQVFDGRCTFIFKQIYMDRVRNDARPVYVKKLSGEFKLSEGGDFRWCTLFQLRVNGWAYENWSYLRMSL